MDGWTDRHLTSFTSQEAAASAASAASAVAVAIAVVVVVATVSVVVSAQPFIIFVAI